MKYRLVCHNNKLHIEFEATKPQDAFEHLAHIEEVFCEQACGKCGSNDIRFSVRETAGNKFYELRCQSCRAALSFGLRRDGSGMFPKRKDKNSQWLENSGWTVWSGRQDTDEF